MPIQDIIFELEQLYLQQSQQFDEPYTTLQFKRRNMLCESVLRDAGVMKSWSDLEEKFQRHFNSSANYVFNDSNLMHGTPSFRFGAEISDVDDKLVSFCFVMSIVRPFFSFYFLTMSDFQKVEF